MNRPTIAVLDYGMGNRRSVQKALEHVGARAEITRDHKTLIAAEGVVVPGVGAFPQAMRNLRELGLEEVIRRRAADGRPVLGVCLGMQLLFEHSTELGGAAGLGLLGGEVTPLATNGLRVPHIGWNHVRWERPSPLVADLPPEGCPFYHVHSFTVRPTSREVVVGTTDYGERFASVVASAPVFGAQFHPEKSSLHGLQMLSAFARICAEEGLPAGTAVAPA